MRYLSLVALALFGCTGSNPNPGSGGGTAGGAAGGTAGGSGGGTQSPHVSVAPSSVVLTVNHAQSFAATVTGASDTSVSWSIREGASGGSIDADGGYIAPAQAGGFTVVATSNAVSSVNATAAVNVVAAAVEPVITAPAHLTSGATGSASIAAQSHTTYQWTATNGTILTGAQSTSITFSTISPGQLLLSCIVTNAAGDAAAPGTATVLVTPIQRTLTAMTAQGVSGTPQNGILQVDAGTQLAYAYSLSDAGVSNLRVEEDGSLVNASGTIDMSADHWLWAFDEPATGTSFQNMIAVPSDPTLVPLPQFYAAQPSFTVTVADPVCAITADPIAYPRSYLGAFPIPAPQGGPLPFTVKRGVLLKDAWFVGAGNPSMNSSCHGGDWHTAVTASMQRIRRLGADHVAIIQNAVLADINATTLSFNCWNGAPCSDLSQIPDSEIAWAAAEALSLGLTPVMYMQVEGTDALGKAYPAPDSTWLNRWFDAYSTFMVHEATIAEANQILVMEADWGVWWFDWTQAPYEALYQTRMAQVLAAMHAVHHGQLLLGSVAPWASDNAALMAGVDLLLVDLFGISFNASDNNAITTAQMKQKYAQVITNYANVFSKYNKPAVFRVQAESYRDYLLDGWIEDAFCPAPGCVENTVATDFSVQAISIESQLEAIAAQTAFNTASIDINSYWYVDVIQPNDSYPNLSYSIRNKPAESIVSHWFQ